MSKLNKRRIELILFMILAPVATGFIRVHVLRVVVDGPNVVAEALVIVMYGLWGICIASLLIRIQEEKNNSTRPPR